MKKAIALILFALLALSAGAALADTVTMTGSVVSVKPVLVTAPIGGTVESVPVTAGDRVAAGDTLLSLKTNLVYAAQAGQVWLFGDPGDAVENVAAVFGGVAVVEPALTWTVSASTARAYDSGENRLIHPAETVYLQSTANNGHVGVGLVTSVSGSSYEIRVYLSGSLEMGETVGVYRSSDHTAASRIGQGMVNRAPLATYTGTGSIVSFLVKNGATVRKGDALFETLDGVFDGSVMTGRHITAPVDGVVASISASAGGGLTKNALVAEIYPDDAMRLQVTVSEADLRKVEVGSRVDIEFDAAWDEYTGGTVEKIALTPVNASAEDAEYTVVIRLDSTEGVRYGMHAAATLDTEKEE